MAPLFTLHEFLARLPAALAAGRALDGGFRLASWAWQEPVGVQAEVVHDDSRGFRLTLTPRDETRPAFCRTPHFDLVHSSAKGSFECDPAVRAALDVVRSAVVEWDDEALGWEFPAPVLLAPATPPSRLGIELDSACHCRCVFCAFPDSGLEREDFDESYHARLVEEVDRAARAGARRLDLSGFDPLTYPRIVDLVAAATRSGFEQVHFFTPGLPLADRALVGRLAAALPAQSRFHIPLYGSTAALHDELSGHPGAFVKVAAGIANLISQSPASGLDLLCVLARQNLHDIGRIRDLARGCGAFFNVHLPFPNTNERGGDPRYLRIAPRLTDVVRVLSRLSPPLRLPEIHPCILERARPSRDAPPAAARTRGAGAKLARLVERRWPACTRPCAARVSLPTPRANGSDFPVREKAATSPAGRAAASPCADEVLQGLRHDDNFRVHRLPSIVERPELAPCPNADRCADAHRCSGVIYKAYVDLYGIAELEPSGRRPTQAKD